MLTKKQLIIKRSFDIIFSFFGLLLLCIPIVILTIFSSIINRKFGLFIQNRIGQNARIFTIYKIRTIRVIGTTNDAKLMELDESGISIAGDRRVSYFGKFLRKNKLDELPQLFNVLIGDMSFVGPRPDIKGYADMLRGKDRKILEIKPGITGPATLAFRGEELLLSKMENPVQYNNEVIWPQKVELNIEYIERWSFKRDLIYIYRTIFN